MDWLRKITEAIAGRPGASRPTDPSRDVNPDRGHKSNDTRAGSTTGLVTKTADGRYAAFGFTFSSLTQAEEYANRRQRRHAPVAPSAPAAPPPPKPTSRPEPVRQQTKSPVPGFPNIVIDADGRFETGNYSFSSLSQAIAYADRRTPKPSSPSVPAWQRLESASAANIVGTAKGLSAPPRWIGEPAEISVGGLKFNAELVYFGTPKRYDQKCDMSRIDPALAVGPSSDRDGVHLSYWPSYQKLHPASRRAYLEWLASGRSKPSTPIGYVFIFFYGLEQRLFMEQSRDEADRILGEVERLLTIYGTNNSFRHYAHALLSAGALLRPNDAPPLQPRPRAELYTFEIPVNVRMQLGRAIAEGRALDANDALLWILNLPDTYLRTPGTRCFEEVCELWRLRFGERHPNGLLVRKPRSTIVQHYRAASATFSATLKDETIPDISGTNAPLGPLRDLLHACCDELAAYSRLLGRDPTARGTLAADLLLPPALRGSGTAKLRETLEQRFKQSQGVIAAAELRALIGEDGPATGARLPALVLRKIAVALDASGFGFEPDPRYGPKGGLSGDSPVAIFPCPAGGPVEPDEYNYATARAHVEAAVLASVADGEVVEAEMEAIRIQLDAAQVSPLERQRLAAYALALARDPPKVSAALKRLKEIPVAGRGQVAESAIAAALADGRVHPAEVKFLESLHTALGLPADDIYSALHRGVSSGTQRKSDRATAIENGSARRIEIDQERLEQLRRDTTKVATLLSSIFEVEDEARRPPAPIPSSSVMPAFSGLEPRHSELLAAVLKRPLTRDEFDAAARALRLLPEGAFEAINEWSFERFDEPLLEDDGTITAAAHLIDELKLIGAES